MFLILSGFFCFVSVLCLENSFALDELVEEEVKKGAESDLEKANLSKQATDSDRHWRWYVVLHWSFVGGCWSGKSRNIEISREKIWSNDGYFKGESSSVTFSKVNYPKFTLLYFNQAYFTVKKSKT